MFTECDSHCNNNRTMLQLRFNNDCCSYYYYYYYTVNHNKT